MDHPILLLFVKTTIFTLQTESVRVFEVARQVAIVQFLPVSLGVLV